MFEFFRKPKPTSFYGVRMDGPGEATDAIDGFVDNLELANFLRKGYRIRSIGPATPAPEGVVVLVAEQIGL